MSKPLRERPTGAALSVQTTDTAREISDCFVYDQQGDDE